jgi:hypothetical protein
MKQRDQLLIVVIIAALALGGFYLTLLKPELKKSHDAASALSAQQARQASALASLTSARTAEVAYRPNLAAIQTAQIAIPPTDKTSSLLDQLDAAARRANVTFNAITMSGSPSSGGAATPAPATGGAAAGATGPAGSAAAAAQVPPVPPGYAVTSAAGLPAVQYSLDFSGGYLKLQKFLAAMQHFVLLRNGQVHAHGRLIDVQGIGVTRGDVTMTVVAYLLSPADQTPLPIPRAIPASVPAAERASRSSASTTPPVASTRVAAVVGGR